MTDKVNVPVDEVLDAVADYLVEQYGKSFGLNHHLDRARIKSSLRAQPEAQKGEPDYTELKRLAEAASAGPWKASGTIYEHMNCEIRTGAKGEGQPIAQVWDGPNAFADGQFIAAASPEVVLGLLARASSPAPASDEVLEKMAAENTRLKAALSAAISADNVLSRAVWAEAELDKIATWLWRQGHQLGREVVADTAIVNLARIRDLSTHPAPASDELQVFADFIADEIHNLGLSNSKLELVKAAFRSLIGRYNDKHKGPQS